MDFSFLTNSFDNVFHMHSNSCDGHDIYDASGNMVDHTAGNIHGGHDVYDTNGNITGHSQANIHGGHDHYDDGNNIVGHDSTNIHGGIDVSNAHGDVTGHFEPVDINGSWGGFDVQHSHDPLMDLPSIELPHFSSLFS